MKTYEKELVGVDPQTFQILELSIRRKKQVFLKK